MKIRAGFVSNSSSSSFVVIGNKLSGIMEVLSLTNEELERVRIFSHEGYDGTEEAELTQELIDELINNFDPYEINSVFSFRLVDWAGEYGTLPNDIQAGTLVEAMTVSHHTSWDYYGLIKWMQELGYGDQRSEEELRMEELLNEN